MKVQLLVALAVVAMRIGCHTARPVASGMPSIPSPKLDQFIFCSETEAEGEITVTINAPEYIESVSHDFFVRRQRTIGEQSLLLYSEAKWQGGNRYPREWPNPNGFEKYVLELLRCQISLKIADGKTFGDLKIEARFYKNRYKSAETISFPLNSGGTTKFGIVELMVSELRPKSVSS